MTVLMDSHHMSNKPSFVKFDFILQLVNIDIVTNIC